MGRFDVRVKCKHGGWVLVSGRECERGRDLRTKYTLKKKIKASIMEQLAGSTEDSSEKYKYSWCHPEAKLGKLYVGMLSEKGCSGHRVWWVWPGSQAAAHLQRKYEGSAEGWAVQCSPGHDCSPRSLWLWSFLAELRAVCNRMRLIHPTAFCPSPVYFTDATEALFLSGFSSRFKGCTRISHGLCCFLLCLFHTAL